MPNFTPNLNLKKPLQTENYNIDDQNGNMDLLDTAVSERLKTADKATQSDAETGTDNTKYMTPLATKQAVIKFAPQLEYKDVTNLSATTAGVITWGLPLATDQTRTAIILCRATKDISNMDYATCLSDSSVTKNTLSKDAVTNTYSGLATGTQYWVKAFAEYTVGGKKYYSNGVTVTFATPNITEFYSAGNEFTAITGGWREGLMGNNPPSVATKASTYLEVIAEAPSGSGANGYATFVTTNPIDFTNIKTLKIDWEGIAYQGGTQGQCKFNVADDANGVSSTIASLSETGVNFSRATRILDVSNITGTHYVSTSAYVISGTGTIQGRKARVYKVWGES